MGGGEVRVCERRIEFFVKIQKKNLGGGGSGGGVGLVGGGGVRVDVKEELKFLRKFKTNFFLGGGGRGGGGGSGWM